MLNQQGGRFLSIKILEEAMQAKSLTNNGTTTGLVDASKFTSHAELIAIISKVHEVLVLRLFLAALDFSR